MAPRAYWKGHIRLALVSFPVRLYAATTSTERISLHRIHKETHERVRMQNVVPDEGPVERDDIVMGYEYDRDKYVPVTEDELEAIQVESKHTIDLSRFVDLDEIDAIYFDKPYFVAPDGDIATEAFVTIRDALRASRKVALGQIVLSKRERIVAIQPCGDGMLLETLRFADEVREFERLLRRHRRRLGLQGPGRDGGVADQGARGRVRTGDLRRPLPGRASFADREEAEGQGGVAAEVGEEQGVQRHQPDGRAEGEPRRERRGRHQHTADPRGEHEDLGLAQIQHEGGERQGAGVEVGRSKAASGQVLVGSAAEERAPEWRTPSSATATNATSRSHPSPRRARPRRGRVSSPS